LIVLVASILVWAALEAAFSRPEPDLRAPRELATGIALLATHAAAITEHLMRHTDVHYIGALAIALGIALRVAAIRALGPAFVSTTVMIDRVTTGPYRFLRHPSELGLVLAASGAAILLSSFAALAIVACAIAPLSVLRALQEDRCHAVATRRAPPPRAA